MAPADVVEIEGLVKEVLSHGRYRVEVKEGHWIVAERSQKFGNTRIVLGDKVRMMVAVYDPTRGLILQRAES